MGVLIAFSSNEAISFDNYGINEVTLQLIKLQRMKTGFIRGNVSLSVLMQIRFPFR